MDHNDPVEPSQSDRRETELGNDGAEPARSDRFHSELGDDLLEHRLINAAQLRSLLPVSAMTIWRYEQQGILPRHITLGGRSFWRLWRVLRALDRIESDAGESTPSGVQQTMPLRTGEDDATGR